MRSETITAVFDTSGDSSNSHLGWVILAGVTSIVLGAAALIYDSTATIASVVLFGWLLMVAGVIEIVNAFQVRTWSGFFLYLLDGIVRTAVGTYLVLYPGTGAQALTLVLSFYFIVAGVFRTIASMSLGFPGWGWSVASGLLSAALGVMLAVQYPSSSQWFIGFAVGIDLVLYGWALLMFAAAVKKLSPAYA